jgi:hypothetical protein
MEEEEWAWFQNGIDAEEWFLMEEFVFKDADTPEEPQIQTESKSSLGCLWFVLLLLTIQLLKETIKL